MEPDVSLLMLTFMRSIMVLYYITVLAASILLIVGISKRDHTKMILFMILMAVGVIIEFLQITLGNWLTILLIVLLALIRLYFVICIYSLYDKIKKEKQGQVKV
ncbi:CLUMA_CG003563, isoform A [Clunio marinus]|uniref:CLUMA_CG003563, isoform A n=1 Tax=Clunio marinus TaxID=568069 RepID=A0A1J1HNP9_9DIPT|nr:CLUMA_CG003563, isoform A [Clunio marinus]